MEQAKASLNFQSERKQSEESPENDQDGGGIISARAL